MLNTTRSCVVCGACIDHLRSIAKYCSRTCVEMARGVRDPGRRSAEGRARKAAQRMARVERACGTPGCNASIPASAPPDRVYCSSTCRDRSYRMNLSGRPHARPRESIARARESRNKWKLLHPVANRLHKAKRDARKRSSMVAPITEAQLSSRFSIFGNRCWMCGSAWENIDHVKPLAAGGPHILANLRPSCRGCNQAKGDSWPLDTRMRQV